MKITLSSRKCGLLAIYFILLANLPLFQGKIGAEVVATISFFLAILCFLIPDHSKGIDKGVQ